MDVLGIFHSLMDQIVFRLSQKDIPVDLNNEYNDYTHYIYQLYWD